MLKPAIVYKAQLEKAFNQIQYSDKMLWYDGCIDIYDHKVETSENKYAFAIVYVEQVIGYVSFRMDWYCSTAYNFSLIKFLDTYFDVEDQIYKDSTPLMMTAIRDIIRMIESFNLHRIDFRCVSGNPAADRYFKLISRFISTYDIHVLKFTDNIKDRQGNYHNTIVYELIHRYN